MELAMTMSMRLAMGSPLAAFIELSDSLRNLHLLPLKKCNPKVPT